MAADQSGHEEAAWVSLVRNGALVAVVLLMIWLAFNADLPALETLQQMAADWGLLGMVAFIGLYAAVAVTPIPVTIMATAAGVLYGVGLGSIVAVIGVTIGAWGGYWLARVLGERTVLRMLGRYRGRIEGHLSRAGFEAICMMRLMPGIPYWPVNYGAGVFGVRQRVYVSASLLSIVPGQVSLVAIGAFAASPTLLTALPVLVSWAVVIVLTVGAYRRWRSVEAEA
ncbi:TVP38/TMEM64 family protein [Nesterenkonia populi]|uniref:TVP38/TMEM64 family protein n=1 Tax=Nesterenkonia populi TaxID=1591087 RepID=UPI001FE31087|nr:TVP38/TMEM64 family protein [Nesterenkonia populi]